jgi:sec-independent protein translocase protein TatA
MRFGSLGPTELLLILVIIVVLFGGARLAGIGGALGQSIREFRKAAKDPEEEARRREEEERRKAEEAGRYTATSVSSPAATNGTAEVRPAQPAAPAQGSPPRPPDFTGS